MPRADLERLEQIAALKFLGIPLKEIKALLESNPLTLLESLRLQLGALTEKREQIDGHPRDRAGGEARQGGPAGRSRFEKNHQGRRDPGNRALHEEVLHRGGLGEREP